MAQTTSTNAKTSPKGQDTEWYMKSRVPVDFPTSSAFTLSQADFDVYLRSELVENKSHADDVHDPSDTATEMLRGDTATIVSTDPSTTADIRNALHIFKMEDVEKEDNKDSEGDSSKLESNHPFMKGLVKHNDPVQPDMSNKMFTQNGDVAFRSTQSELVDLFYELESVVSGPRLFELLNNAWKVDSLASLKIIYNARSIHLGKSSRVSFYRCVGWLAQHHPLTLVQSLQWLSRPVIEKKIEKKTKGADDIVMVEAEKDENDPSRFDVKHGVAHGYWKDLLNILALSANKKLDVLSDPKSVLNIDERQAKPKTKNWDAQKAQELRRDTRDNRHSEAVSLFQENPVHRALHIAVARLFAEQLKADLVRLRSGNAGAKRHISLCAKWAPSAKAFHDKHTYILSSIAEILHPQSEFPTESDRESYLRRAREAARKDISALRKYLEVVERELTAKTLTNIKYDHVPSIAMNNYAGIFAEKDMERFEQYIDKVAAGKKKISGAVLLPSTLVKAASQSGPSDYNFSSPSRKRRGGAKDMVSQKLAQIDTKVVDGQWKTLVQRIKDSGSLSSSIAVCDVSGSMTGPVFPDGTTPMHSSVGLALLLAEVTQPPFGGAFITFSHNPKVERIDLTADLRTKISQLDRSDWSMNTDFEAVFEKLILPMAIKEKLKPEDMVKQIFVFSDMQFDQAQERGTRWETAFERIERKFKAAGYEMPKLVFWNLAGGRAGYGGQGGGDATAPKPVTHDQVGTAMVSGYSQGMLKVFLDNGSFANVENEEEIEVVEKDGEGDEDVVEVKKKVKMDPVSIMRKAIGHKAYNMLKVFD